MHYNRSDKCEELAGLGLQYEIALSIIGVLFIFLSYACIKRTLHFILVRQLMVLSVIPAYIGQ